MTNTSETQSPVSDRESAGAREWAGLAVLTLPCLVVAMNAHVLLLAVPQLSADLQPTGSQLLWIMDSYAFLVAGCLIPAGALGDRLGRRRLLLVGAAGFAGASVVAALAPTAIALIVARGVQGAAGATLMPSTLALIRQLFTDERRRTVALGVWTASFALGGVVGPLLAGVLLSRFWWGSVFLVGVPVMLLLLVLGPVLLPEASVTTRGRVDGTGTVLALITVLAAVYALKAVASDGVSLRPAVAAAVALIAAVAFVRQQRRTPDPLVDPALLRRRRFSLPVTINAGAFFLLYGTQVALTQYLQLVLGLKPLPAALIGIPSALAYLAGSALGPVAAQRLTPPVLLGVGLALSIAGFVMVAAADGDTAIPVIVTGTVVASLGLAPVYLLTTQLAITAAPPAQAGAASAVSEAGAELGGALGMAALGSLAVAVYQHQLTGAEPAGITPDVAAASRTLGGALAAAEHLPSGPAAELIQAARQAYTHAFAVSELVGAGLLAVLSVLALTALVRSERRQSPSRGEPAGQAGAEVSGTSQTSRP